MRDPGGHGESSAQRADEDKPVRVEPHDERKAAHAVRDVVHGSYPRFPVQEIDAECGAFAAVPGPVRGRRCRWSGRRP